MCNVLDWLEACEGRRPGKVAFADVDSQLTYAQLVQGACVVGSAIARMAEPRKPIALFLDKTTRAIIGLFGAVYAGCCYSFIDLRQPSQRIAKIIETLQPAFVVVDAQSATLARDVFPADVELVEIETLLAGEADGTLLDDRRQQARPSDPLYINFTSGSTGTPKGVAVCHASVMGFIPVFDETLGITADDVFANQAPLDFDVSVKDVYSALYLGATVHLIPRDYFSVPTQLLDYLCERRPTVLVWAVSAMCFVSIMKGFDYKVPETVRLVAFSGEVMPVKQLNVWRAALPQARFANVYGPTEITCNCTYYIIDRVFESGEVIPIGRPFSINDVFLIGADGGRVIESDVPGELYVGGPTVALGYWNDPERTAKAFVPHPLAAEGEHGIVYKTGDLARYDENGDLVYLSRVDHQIKHMGQRIELGEIDAAAHAVEGVTRACCVYDSVRKRIRMFYTGTIDKKDLSAALHEALPPFMTPNTIRQLSAMPLTKNGKIDRARLESGEVE